MHFDPLAAGDKTVATLTEGGIAVSDMAAFTALGLKTLASHPANPSDPTDTTSWCT